jgi:hypothetical protein
MLAKIRVDGTIVIFYAENFEEEILEMKEIGYAVRAPQIECGLGLYKKVGILEDLKVKSDPVAAHLAYGDVPYYRESQEILQIRWRL